MNSNDYEYEYYSDSSIEEDNDQPVDVELLYKKVTNLIRNIIDDNPLSNDLPLSDAIESRIAVLSELCDVIEKRYSAINDSWFWHKLNDLEEAIHGFAQQLDDMESKYKNLEYSLDTGATDEYLNNTRRKIIEDFNEFISNDIWLFIDPRPYEVRKRLPIADSTKTGQQIKEDLDYYLNHIQLFVNSTQKEVKKQLPLLDELKIPEDLI